MQLRENYNAGVPSANEVKELRINYIKANLKRLGDTWRNNKENLSQAEIHELFDLDLKIKELIKSMERALEKD